MVNVTQNEEENLGDAIWDKTRHKDSICVSNHVLSSVSCSAFPSFLLHSVGIAVAQLSLILSSYWGHQKNWKVCNTVVVIKACQIRSHPTWHCEASKSQKWPKGFRYNRWKLWVQTNGHLALKSPVAMVIKLTMCCPLRVSLSLTHTCTTTHTHTHTERGDSTPGQVDEQHRCGR